MTVDIVPGVPLELHPTEAHGATRPVTRGIVLHSTRGPTRPSAGEGLASVLEREYEVAVRYLQNPANEVSPHFCVGPTKVARMVSDNLIAWHAREHNQTHLGIEIAQPAYCPEFVAFQYTATAEVCAHWCWKYGLAPVHVTDSGQNGIIAHSETDQGRRDGKSDPGPRWDWDRLIPMVAARLRELDSAYGAYGLAGAGIQSFLRRHPQLGVPSKVYWDKFGNEVCFCLGTAAHPHGVVVMWRKWLAEQGHDAIRVMSWDEPCVT